MRQAAFSAAAAPSRACLRPQHPRTFIRHGVVCHASRTGSSQPPYTVLITGSTKGIGLALARKFLAEGDNVVICSRKEDRVKATLSELRSDFGKQRVTGAACNVCKQSEIAALTERAKSEFGSIDIWINNAGTNAYSYKPLIEAAATDLVDIVDTNVLGTMLCCQAAIKLMREQPSGGHIFNMEGAGSDGTPTPRFAAYGATKRALTQLNKSLQSELKNMEVTNIGIHNLSPGMVTTELLMSGADTAQAKFFINCMAEPPETVAGYLVSRVREVPRKKSSGTAIRFLTPARAYGNILQRLVLGKNKGRFVVED